MNVIVIVKECRASSDSFKSFAGGKKKRKKKEVFPPSFPSKKVLGGEIVMKLREGRWMEGQLGVSRGGWERPD